MLDGGPGFPFNFSEADANSLRNIIHGYTVLAWFAGHLHAHEDFLGEFGDYFSNRTFPPKGGRNFPVVLTEALMRGANKALRDGGGPEVIRRVEIRYPLDQTNPLDYNTMFGIYPALNPNFLAVRGLGLEGDYPVSFAGTHFSDRPVFKYVWYFIDDKKTITIESKPGEAVSYPFKEDKEYKVTLTVVDAADRRIRESIRKRIKPSELPWVKIDLPFTLDQIDLLTAYQQREPAKIP